MQELIKRNTPEIADRFALEIEDRREGKSFYEIEACGDKIVLRGDCKISLAMAYYRYLKDCCGVNLAHCGNDRIGNITEAPLPAGKTVRIIEQDKRAYMNYCTFSYSARWWDWERWEREIDYMAMRGINMPLSIVGYEAVFSIPCATSDIRTTERSILSAAPHICRGNSWATSTAISA